MSIPLGSPLTQHKNFEQPIIDEYDNHLKRSNMLFPFEWSQTPQFDSKMMSNDYRFHKAVNFPYMIVSGTNNDFFYSFAKILIDYRESIDEYNEEKNEEKDEKKQKDDSNKFYSRLKKKIGFNDGTNFISNFLNINNKGETCNILIESIAQIFENLGLNAIKSLNQILSKLSGYSSIIVFLEIMIWAANDSTLQKQRAENCEKIINNFFNIVTNHPNHVLDSNLFLYSIDLRDFSRYSPFTLFRENHGAWCDFIYLDKVRSPRGCDFKGHKLILAYRDIYSKISSSDRVNIVSMKNFLNGTIGWNNALLNYEDDDDDDDNEQSLCNIF